MSPLISDLLKALSHTGTAITVAISLCAIALATHCRGRCKQDPIFRRPAL